MGSQGDGDDDHLRMAVVENICQYPVKLKLISSPNKIEVDGSNWNAEFNKAEWQQEPKLELEAAEPEKTYTIVAIDPDAPLHFKGEAVLHWLLSNVKGQDLATGNMSGTTFQDYRGPGPVPLTGLHRYVFLVYEEAEVNQEVMKNDKRLKFKLHNWLNAQKKQLTGPIAGVQFRSKY